MVPSDRVAEETSRIAIERDPENAKPYVILGTALAQLGHLKEAKAVFGGCAVRAKRGDKSPCHQFK